VRGRVGLIRPNPVEFSLSWLEIVVGFRVGETDVAVVDARLNSSVSCGSTPLPSRGSAPAPPAAALLLRRPTASFPCEAR
jgi:hypothetical protein